MLPIKLKMQAFASYAEAAEIDFKKLDKLFLIHGETGAGKTAVLDAMMYALYGESSGGERTEMRCTLPAAEKLPTEVEFTFTIHDKLYTFTRSITVSPRSKKQETRQDCFYYDEDGTRRAFFENPKQSSVRAKAEELTGLSAKQFRQVVILPQGKFEQLLVSGSAEKETILSTLFGAEKYSRLSEKLSEKADAQRKELAAENAALKALLAAENADTPEQLADERDRLKAEAEQLSPKLTEERGRLKLLREKLTAAELLSEKFSELHAAEKRLEELDKRTDKVENARTLLQKHEKASEAKPEQAALTAAEKALAVRKESHAAAEKALHEAEKTFAEAVLKKDMAAAEEAENKSRTDELAVLESLAALYGKISSAEDALKRTSAERADCEKSHRITMGKLENTSAEIARLSELREKITREFSRALPGLAARKSALEQGAGAEKRLKKYTDALEKIKAKASALEAEAERLGTEKAAAGSVYDRLYGEYLSNAAAELSSRLKENMPCPVCGSLSHPYPAARSKNAVTAEDVKNARGEFERLAAAFSDKLAEAAAEKARIPAAEEYIAAERKIIADTGYSASELKAVSAKHGEAMRRNDSLTDIDKSVAEMSAFKASLEELNRTESDRLAEIKSSETRAEAELSSLRERLDPRFKDAASFSAYVMRLKTETESFARKRDLSRREFSEAEKRRIEAAAAFTQTEKELDGAEKNASGAEKAFLEKLSRLGITPSDYKNSLLDEERAAGLAADIRQYDLDIHSVRERIRILNTELEGKSPPQLDGLRSAASDAEASLSALTEKNVLTLEKLKRLQKLTEEYSARFSKLEARRESSDKLTAFAGFMRGDKGISFTRYVLSIMLSLVTTEANRILTDIHGGKFRLRVKSDLAANSKQGLDLEVENLTADYSVRYGVKNLSGGEQFLISLALSLGLSAVAGSRNGGVEIEAMFIDEGFGSLDPASLREAVSILCGLSLGRNTVGIISQVEELKNIIPCCLAVSKGLGGASVINFGA